MFSGVKTLAEMNWVNQSWWLALAADHNLEMAN